MTAFISRFTPSLMAPETLEALFIQRARLAEQVLDDIRQSATTAARHYHLLIGARGLGKTHFVALLQHRVKSDPELAERVRIAWLREEEHGVSSYLELLKRILQALAREYQHVELAQGIHALYELTPKAAARAAEALLVESLGKRTLLLLVENLDAILLGMKTAGQHALRAFLYQGNCTILATALYHGVSPQDAPFHGFFRVHDLQELSLEEAVELLAVIAEARGDAELASFIRTPLGRARIRAVHHIAGGNHRIYVVFSEFLTREALEELVTPFMRMLDDLMPGYQGRMALLSPQQQMLVEHLAHVGGAQPVKEIAKQCFLTQQTVANQLRQLTERGFVQDHTPHVDKRETYYELREPLLRLCCEVKEYRGGTIRLFVNFLRDWYTQKEVFSRLTMTSNVEAFTIDCLQDALDRLERDGSDPRIRACEWYLQAYLKEHNWANGVKVAAELLSLADSAVHWFVYAGMLFLHGADAQEVLNACQESFTRNHCTPQSYLQYGMILTSYGRFTEAKHAIDTALSIKPDYDEALHYQVELLITAGCFREAFSLIAAKAASMNHVTEEKPVTIPWREVIDICNAAEQAITADKPMIWAIRGLARCQVGRFDEAIIDWENAVSADDPELSLAPCSQPLTSRGEKRVTPHERKAGDRLVAHWCSIGILASVAAISTPLISSIQRSRWFTLCQRLLGRNSAMDSMVEILSMATEYLNTGDDRRLLMLPLEVRKGVAALIEEGQQVAAMPASDNDANGR